ncbi:hypothetical protein CXB51_000967 [Gossypium anomalum]|uniref:Endonuclease/exonuclease/phosphatase domain-containing protein n=1 Tax=Gossypium anomalum TaxID=47600 RepID=A0A8J5ZLA6_9ROSI|nr:hypothetical protein CXB51_000967 [Gossypium anomalum]
MVVDSSPVSGISWKYKLLGGLAPNSPDGSANFGLEFEEGDIRRSNLNGIPTIDFSDRITKILIKGMELTVVVKLLGHNTGYGALFTRINSLWKPTRSFRLMDVANGYYLVRFHCQVDYDVALIQAWIHFLGLPGFLYQKKILEEIRSLVGEVIKVDIKTYNRERGQFARMAIFVDLEKLLTSQVFVNGQIKRVEFEALPEVCFSCGKYRHLKNLCPSSLTSWSSHGDVEIPRNMLNSETTLAIKGDALLTLSSMALESLMLDSEAPSNEPEMVGFIQRDFIKKLKSNEIGQRSKAVAVFNLGEGFSGSVVKGGPDPISGSLARLSPRIREVNFDNSGPHSAMVLTQMGIEAADRFNSQSASGQFLKAINGCASSKLVRVFRDYNWEHRLDLISLLETRVSGEKANLVIAKLGFHNSHRVEAVDFSGGIWIGWKDSVSVEVLQSHPQFVLAKVNDSSFRHPLLVSFVYGSPNSQKRKHFWEALQSSIPLNGSPWVAIGDFNAILTSSEKKRG